jgi:hypothetical protein
MTELQRAELERRLNAVSVVRIKVLPCGTVRLAKNG